MVNYLSIAGTFVEWATGEHFRVGLPRDGRFGEMELFSDSSDVGIPCTVREEERRKCTGKRYN